MLNVYDSSVNSSAINSSPSSSLEVPTPPPSLASTPSNDFQSACSVLSSTVIIGAGSFGAATALTLVKQGVHVILIDTAPFPCPRAASHDISKIVRDDYPDLLYMRMMVKAMPMWRSHPLYEKWYHEVGMLRADPSGFAKQSMAAYKKMGIGNDSKMLSVEEVFKRWDGVFATTNFDGLTEVLYNPTVGIAEADRVLEAVIQAGIDHGVKYLIGEMDKLVFGPSSECVGVALKSGEVVKASNVLLAAGARTGPLLVNSAPGNKKLHIAGRSIAMGAISFYANMHGQEQKFTSIPVLKNCLDQVKGESMSVLADGIMKVNCDMCFTNNIELASTSEVMSQPPDESKYNTWTSYNFVKLLQERSLTTFRGLYGAAIDNVAIKEYRICWDACTPTYDFLITPHPHCDGLYVATGGSFHGWKFLPVIGDYIVAMMLGQLDEDYVDRWAWDKKSDDGHSTNKTYQAAGDLQDWI